MKNTWLSIALGLLFVSMLHAQNAPEKVVAGHPSSVEAQELRGDIDRLKVILNQMRTNLAFVQTSQTPLKHQFELETDAWQVILEQMDRRLKQMEERNQPEAGH
ncbi:MAG: hypothetical protein HY010_18610 [Acidobacteria bacterium]|nr:hypothetical protein [Acidobacteriota bacterium]